LKGSRPFLELHTKGAKSMTRNELQEKLEAMIGHAKQGVVHNSVQEWDEAGEEFELADEIKKEILDACSHEECSVTPMEALERLSYAKGQMSRLERPARHDIPIGKIEETLEDIASETKHALQAAIYFVKCQ
jgi:hypothetical protein